VEPPQTTEKPVNNHFNPLTQNGTISSILFFKTKIRQHKQCASEYMTCDKYKLLTTLNKGSSGMYFKANSLWHVYLGSVLRRTPCPKPGTTCNQSSKRVYKKTKLNIMWEKAKLLTALI
jgi:hypothetical protein